MSFIKRSGATARQVAYARRIFDGEGVNKKQVALDVGYSPNVARSVASHIESKPGFNNAMAALAKDSNCLALAAMHEFKARGFEDFSNKDLTAALNAIGNAWSKFNAPLMPKGDGNKEGTNKLRNVILQRIENQTLIQGDKPPREAKEEEFTEAEIDLDF